MIPLTIPSPDQGVWHLGPLPIRGYALCIILGIVAAVWIGERRWVARGGRPSEVTDLALWAVPFGLVGGRLYHVITDWKPYFGEDGSPMGRALRLAWRPRRLGRRSPSVRWACSSAPARKGIKVLPMLDALAPGVLVAQAIGRWGNWFNQELFGRPTDLPWGLEIDAAHRPSGYRAVRDLPPDVPLRVRCGTSAAFAFVIWADRRFRLGHGRVLRALRDDLHRWVGAGSSTCASTTVQLNDVFGLRLNVWTSIVLFVAVDGVLRVGHAEATGPGGARVP